MLAVAFAALLLTPAFGSDTTLRPHQVGLDRAERAAEAGDWARARAELLEEKDVALPEAAGLLELHVRMLDRLRDLDRAAPGLGRPFVRYVFAPPKERFPGAMADLKVLADHDLELKSLLRQPVETVVDHDSEAVALMLRGALVDVGQRHGLPLHTATGPGRLRVIIEQEDVGQDTTFLRGTGMHSYTTHVVVLLSRPGRVDVTNGSIQQYLGINEARSLDTNLARFADRTLNAVAVELIRRSLLDELGR